MLASGQTTAVKSIEKYLEERDTAVAGECIGLTTIDSPFLERGDVLAQPGAEPTLTDTIVANIIWMSKRQFSKDQRLSIRCATQQTTCKIESIDKRIDSSTLEVIAENDDVIENLEVAQVVIRTKKPLAVTNFNDVQELGRFTLVRDGNTCAGGIVISDG